MVGGSQQSFYGVVIPLISGELVEPCGLAGVLHQTASADLAKVAELALPVRICLDLRIACWMENWRACPALSLLHLVTSCAQPNVQAKDLIAAHAIAYQMAHGRDLVAAHLPFKAMRAAPFLESGP